MPKPPPKDVDAEVRAIYAALEGRPFERSCVARTTCCRFKLTGSTPYLTKAEALVAAQAWESDGPRQAAETGPGRRLPDAR